jgi:hypothetical protein
VDLIGLYLVAAGLLVGAGVAKALRPDDTARALATLVPRPARGMASPRRLRAGVRAGASTEAAVGVLALALPRPATAVLVAVSYAAFAGVVGYALARGGALASCGCFGRPDTPATVVHVLVDLALASACAAVALRAPNAGSLVTVLAHQPLAGVPLLFVSAVGLWLTYLALSVLPALEGARRLVRRRPGTAVPVR